MTILKQKTSDVTEQGERFVKLSQARINHLLKDVVPNQSPTQLKEAMQYSLMARSKRFRPTLVYAIATTLGVELDQNPMLDNIALAIELLHTYSLIHDDLPAMDDDDYRRGKLSCHKKFDEATAILAADGLHSLAFEIISNKVAKTDSATQIKCINILAKAIGPEGMVGGQMLDMQNESKQISMEELKQTHLKKTSALIAASMQLGLLVAKPNAELKQLGSIHSAGLTLGLAFQIMDDILDTTGNLLQLGKKPGSDLKQNKNSYVSLLEVDGAKKLLVELNRLYQQELAEADCAGELMFYLGNYAVSRVN